MSKKLIMNKFAEKYRNMTPALKATLWFVICSVLQRAISIITLPLFTRILTTAQYGQYTVYNSWQQTFAIICTFRLDYAVFNKGMSKFPERRNEYTSAMQGLTSLITIILFLVYLLFHQQINSLTELSTFITLMLFAELLFMPAISFWSLRKRYDFEYKPVVAVTLLMAVVNPIIGLIAVHLSEDKGNARILSCIAVQLCFGLVLYVLNLRRGKKLVAADLWKFAFMFNLPLIPHYFSTYILEQSDRIMIQKFWGLDAVALYGIAYSAGTLMKIVTTSMHNALVPWQYRKLQEREFTALGESMTVMFVIVAACVVTFSAFAPELMLILGGEQYTQAMYVVPPISASLFFIFVYGTFSNVEFFYDANKFTMIISLASAIVNIALNFIFIPLFGYVAASYTTLTCYTLLSMGHYLYMDRIVKAKEGISIYPKKTVLSLSAAVIVLTIAVGYIYDLMLIRYALVLLVVVICVIKRKSIIKYLKIIRQ